MSSLKYWLWLTNLEGVTKKVQEAALEAFEDPEAVFFADEGELKAALPGIRQKQLEALSVKRLDGAKKILDVCSRKDIGILTLQDAEYPTRLKNIYNPPFVLYTRGKLQHIDDEAVIGIVGTRSATPYGIKMGTRMGFEVTKCGGLVVSGLALGIDTAGARGALRAGGSCVGVLGCAIDEVYPKENWSLYEDVAAVGVLVSEYAPGRPTKSENFPARNRIISGLSCGVLVVEVPKRSGAKITALEALEQGRDLFAVPGNADSPQSVGSNELLKEGAKAVTCGWDILSEYTALYPDKIKRPRENNLKIPQEDETGSASAKMVRAKKADDVKEYLKLREPVRKKAVDTEPKREYDLEARLSELSGDQRKIAEAIRSPETHVDDIIEASGLPARTVLSQLTMLQLRGVVSQHGGKRFSLKF